MMAAAVFFGLLLVANSIDNLAKAISEKEKS
jgi:hypothetical protein